MTYGDDGEMQCCGIDFKRWTAEEIDKHLTHRAELARLAADADKPAEGAKS